MTFRETPTPCQGPAQPAEVLYLHPAKQGVGFPYHQVQADTQYYLMPVGIIGLANMLRQEGLAVRGLNEPLERLLDPDFEIGSWLRAQPAPRLILIDLHWYEHSYGAIDLARLCKKVWPKTPVVMGGLTASGFADEILDAHHQVDVIIRGDAEEPLRQLARALCHEGRTLDEVALEAIPNVSYRHGWDVMHSPLRYCAAPEELEALDFCGLDFMEHARYYRGLQYASRLAPYVLADGPPLLGHWLSIGRGCVYDCSFCGGGAACHQRLASRGGLVARSPQRVADDLERLAADGVHQAALTLDLCIMGSRYWETLFSEITRRAIPIGLYNEHFQLPSLAFVEAFARAAPLAHSELALSVLSREPVRRLNGKGYSDTQLWRVLSALKARQVPVVIYFSLNLPGETEEGFARTLRLAERIGQFYPTALLRMFGQPHTVDPFAPMSLEAERYGVETSLRSFQDYYAYCQRTAAYHADMPVDDQRGFRWQGRAPGESDRIVALWAAFCRQQPFACE